MPLWQRDGARLTMGKCIDCGVPLAPWDAWYRKGIRPEGHRPHEGRGLCGRDYHRWYRAKRRQGNLEKVPEAPRTPSCAACRAPMVPRARWTRGERPEGHKPIGARGLCRPCYRRELRAEKFAPRRNRSLFEVLEDYRMIRDDVATVAQAAERMGMTYAALDKALYRARRRGMEGALPPRQQLERAIAKGQAGQLLEAS